MIHIGKLILQQVNAQGISKSELARRLNVSPQNVYNLFKRKTVQASMLKKISGVLKFDFFNLYEPLEYCQKSKRVPVDKKSDCYLEYERLQRELNRLRDENECLKLLIGLKNRKRTNNGNVKGVKQPLAQYQYRSTRISRRTWDTP